MPSTASKGLEVNTLIGHLAQPKSSLDGVDEIRDIESEAGHEFSSQRVIKLSLAKLPVEGPRCLLG